MLEPRIYRTGLVAVALALIVFAFSLQDQSGGLASSLTPDSFSGPNADATMTALATQSPARQPGSGGDRRVADYVAQRLKAYGFAVDRSSFSARTALGTRMLQNVTGTLAGSSTSAIVIVAARDGGAAPDGLSGTAALLELARVLAGETERHTIVLASVSGSASDQGADQLARDLPEPVDAVLALGDLAATPAHPPLVVPWSRGQAVAPGVLRNTVAGALAAQGQPGHRGYGLASQLLHQAFPVSVSMQAPFDQVGAPAVLVSRTGEASGPVAPTGRAPADAQAATAGTAQAVSTIGRAVLQSVNALDAGADVPAPSAYLVVDGKLIPDWSIRLLVLALILPVAMAAIDALARMRRRGHPVLGSIAAAVAAATGFLLAALVITVARTVGLLSGAPGGPVPAGTAPAHAGGVATMVLALIGLLAGLLVLRARLTGLSGGTRAGGQPAAVGVLAVLCAAALAIWFIDPFAALLLVPALHVWMWLGADAPLARPLKLVLWLLGVAVPALAVVYYGLTVHLGPLDVVWNGVLMIAGGQLSTAAVALWSVVFGCFASVLVLAFRRAPQEREHSVAITVRGPVSYAGPGSLGGTESALRR